MESQAGESHHSPVTSTISLRAVFRRRGDRQLEAQAIQGRCTWTGRCDHVPRWGIRVMAGRPMFVTRAPHQQDDKILTCSNLSISVGTAEFFVSFVRPPPSSNLVQVQHPKNPISLAGFCISMPVHASTFAQYRVFFVQRVNFLAWGLFYWCSNGLRCAFSRRLSYAPALSCTQLEGLVERGTIG